MDPAPPAADTPVIWRLDHVNTVAGLTPTVWGAPHVATGPGGGAIQFNGVADGLLFAANPLAGAKEFTVEILFRPEEGGGAEERFVHIQDDAGGRAMIELRADGNGHWWLDTFLRTSDPGRALIDPKKTHPTGHWYWAALRYDGKTMSNYIDGVKEMEGDVAFAPMTTGKISLGVRQNHLYWFKGSIAEIRFHSSALAPEKLQRSGP